MSIDEQKNDGIVRRKNAFVAEASEHADVEVVFSKAEVESAAANGRVTVGLGVGATKAVPTRKGSASMGVCRMRRCKRQIAAVRRREIENLSKTPQKQPK